MAEYYVRATGGNDTNDGLSFANGWATLTHADGVVAAGDTLYICSDNSNAFTGVTALNFATDTTGFISFYGADLVDGSPYNGSGKAYIVGTTALTMFNNYIIGHKWKDIDFNGNEQTQRCFDDSSNCIFDNCSFHHFTNRPIRSDGNKPIVFKKCNIYVNNISTGSSAIYIEGTEYNATFIDCAIHHNSKSGIIARTSYLGAHPCIVRLYGTRIYKNDDDGIYLQNSNISAINNIIFGNVGNAVEMSIASVFHNFYNNIVVNNGGYGIYHDYTSIKQLINFDYNCFYNNTSGNVSSLFNGGVLPGANNILSDPQFTDITDSTEDFSLQVTSPCINKGSIYIGGQP